jgi:hypothetical protein
MKKPEAPTRPNKPNRSVWEKSKKNKESSLTVKSDRRNSIPLQRILDLSSKLSTEDLKVARLHVPKGIHFETDKKGWPWKIQTKVSRDEKELDKMWSEIEARHKSDLEHYRREMKAYKIELEKWRKIEKQRIEKEYQEKLKRIGEG